MSSILGTGVDLESVLGRSACDSFQTSLRMSRGVVSVHLAKFTGDCDTARPQFASSRFKGISVSNESAVMQNCEVLACESRIHICHHNRRRLSTLKTESPALSESLRWSPIDTATLTSVPVNNQAALASPMCWRSDRYMVSAWRSTVSKSSNRLAFARACSVPSRKRVMRVSLSSLKF